MTTSNERLRYLIRRPRAEDYPSWTAWSGAYDQWLGATRVLAAELLGARARIAALEAELECDACGGTGTPVSDLPCACGGTGKVSDAWRYLRAEYMQLETENEALCKVAEAARGVDPNGTCGCGMSPSEVCGHCASLIVLMQAVDALDALAEEAPKP